MLTTSTAAVAAVLADYLRCRQLAALAHANYRAVDAAVGAHMRANPAYIPVIAHDELTRRRDAIWKGCLAIDAQLATAAAMALAVGAITWAEYQQTMQV